MRQHRFRITQLHVKFLRHSVSWLLRWGRRLLLIVHWWNRLSTWLVAVELVNCPITSTTFHIILLGHGDWATHRSCSILRRVCLSQLLVVSDKLLGRLYLRLVSNAQVSVGARLAKTLVIVRHRVVVHWRRVMGVELHGMGMVIATVHLSWMVAVVRRVMLHHHVVWWWRRVMVKVMRLAWRHVVVIMLVAKSRGWVKTVTRLVIDDFRVDFAH